MVTLRDGETGQPIGTISDEQLRFLQDQLEEESPSDQDYWIDPPTLDALREAGADEALVKLLESAIGGREGCEVRWDRT
jgi:hypothetical protein